MCEFRGKQCKMYNNRDSNLVITSWIHGLFYSYWQRGRLEDVVYQIHGVKRKNARSQNLKEIEYQALNRGTHYRNPTQDFYGRHDLTQITLEPRESIFPGLKRITATLPYLHAGTFIQMCRNTVPIQKRVHFFSRFVVLNSNHEQGA